MMVGLKQIDNTYQGTTAFEEVGHRWPVVPYIRVQWTSFLGEPVPPIASSADRACGLVGSHYVALRDHPSVVCRTAL